MTSKFQRAPRFSFQLKWKVTQKQLNGSKITMKSVNHLLPTWKKSLKKNTDFRLTKLPSPTQVPQGLLKKSTKSLISGAYRVMLSTETQSVESSCQVTITDASDAGDGKPAFRKGLADQKVPKGAPLRLEIEVDGKPKEVKWYRNGDELKPDGKKVKVEDLGNGKYALVIPETGDEDFGNYSVTVSNDKGTAESKANISVQGR